MMRERLAMIAAIAMIGTACSGPKAITSTGISMIDEPKPTMPLSVPATRPTATTKKYSNLEHVQRLRPRRRTEQLVELGKLSRIKPVFQCAEIFLQPLALARLRYHDDAFLLQQPGERCL